MRRIFPLLLIAALALYYYWRSGTGYSGPTGRQPAVTFEKVSLDSGRGNLVAIQPFMYPQDYASAKAFEDKLDHYFRIAQQRGTFNAKTIVALPEYLGTWLVALDEKSSVYSSRSVTEAFTTLVLRHPLNFLWHYFLSDEPDRDKAALFRVKSTEMAEAYQAVFRSLASQYRVTVVAGSVVLPGPEVVNGQLRVNRNDRLYNVSAVFRPDGSIDPMLVKKVFPIVEEQGFVNAGSADELPVFETPAGRLGVLVCADSWYPEPYSALKNRGADLLVVPSYSSPDSLWSTDWKGYNGAPFPADVDRSDVGRISEGEAWKKYAIGKRSGEAGIQNGINVFLRGSLWDLGSDGHTLYVRRGVLGEHPAPTGASIVCLWL
jgi:hypothetical protein